MPETGGEANYQISEEKDERGYHIWTTTAGEEIRVGDFIEIASQECSSHDKPWLACIGAWRRSTPVSEENLCPGEEVEDVLCKWVWHPEDVVAENGVPVETEFVGSREVYVSGPELVGDWNPVGSILRKANVLPFDKLLNRDETVELEGVWYYRQIYKALSIQPPLPLTVAHQNPKHATWLRTRKGAAPPLYLLTPPNPDVQYDKCESCGLLFESFDEQGNLRTGCCLLLTPGTTTCKACLHEAEPDIPGVQERPRKRLRNTADSPLSPAPAERRTRSATKRSTSPDTVEDGNARPKRKSAGQGMKAAIQLFEDVSGESEGSEAEVANSSDDDDEVEDEGDDEGEEQEGEVALDDGHPPTLPTPESRKRPIRDTTKAEPPPPIDDVSRAKRLNKFAEIIKMGLKEITDKGGGIPIIANPEEFASELVGALDSHAYENGLSSKMAAQRMHERFQNLKRDNNFDLRRRLITGDMTLPDFAAADVKELAPEHLKRQRERDVQKYFQTQVMLTSNPSKLIRKTHKGLEELVEEESGPPPGRPPPADPVRPAPSGTAVESEIDSASVEEQSAESFSPLDALQLKGPRLADFVPSCLRGQIEAPPDLTAFLKKATVEACMQKVGTIRSADIQARIEEALLDTKGK